MLVFPLLPTTAQLVYTPMRVCAHLFFCCVGFSLLFCVNIQLSLTCVHVSHCDNITHVYSVQVGYALSAISADLCAYAHMFLLASHYLIKDSCTAFCVQVQQPLLTSSLWLQDIARRRRPRGAVGAFESWGNLRAGASVLESAVRQ